MKLSIVYQDNDIVAVYKPAGIVVHRCDTTPKEEIALLQLLRDQIRQHVYPVHRLDQPTSGLVLYGLSSAAAASLVDQFTNRRVYKCYQALVVGHVPDCGLISIPLETSENRPVDAIEIRSSLKPLLQAETEFRRLAKFSPDWILGGPIEKPVEKPIAEPIEGEKNCSLSLIEAVPRTGRWHQIRRHLAKISHPILGDRRHGNDDYNNWKASTAPFHSLHSPAFNDRLMLNASYIRFHHPSTDELIELRCDPDPSYQAIVDLLGAPVP